MIWSILSALWDDLNQRKDLTLFIASSKSFLVLIYIINNNKINLYSAATKYIYTLLRCDGKNPNSATLQSHNHKLFKSFWKQVRLQQNFEDANIWGFPQSTTLSTTVQRESIDIYLAMMSGYLEVLFSWFLLYMWILPDSKRWIYKTKTKQIFIFISTILHWFNTNLQIIGWN